jgi:hypothetical protein
MNYCSLDDAFPTTEGAPSPGCTSDQAAKQARKEERRKIKRCKQIDPDRQQYGKLPDVPVMNGATGLPEHAPVVAPQGEMDSSSWKHDTMSHGTMEPLMEPFEPLMPTSIPNREYKATDYSQPSQPFKKKSFFGADPEDSFADYIPDQKDYQLQPDFSSVFEQNGLEKAMGKALPMASASNYWKPLTQSGAQTSFVESLPPPGGKYYKQSYQQNEVSMQEVMKRMDMLFARLDDLNATTPEQMTSELLMFISSGIFVLFMMDLLVKKGSMMRF